MSRAKDSLDLDIPIDTVHAAVKRALERDGWRVQSEDRASFLAREPGDLFSRMLRHPSKVAVFLFEQSDTETRLDLHGSIFGFGPLQNARVRKALAKLRGAIEAELAAL